MVTCEPCPYPAKCNAREKCISGRIPGYSEPLPEPKPMNVMTTKGTAKTGVKAKKKKDEVMAYKKGKKKTKGIRMQSGKYCSS